MIEKISGLRSEAKPSRSSHGSSLKGEVFVDIGCADASDPICSPNNGSLLMDVEDTQKPQDFQNCGGTLGYHEGYAPVVLGFSEGHPAIGHYPPQPSVCDFQKEIDYSSLLPAAATLTGFMPDTFYIEDRAQICNLATDIPVVTWDQFQLGCQQDYSISVPWSLELDFQCLTAPAIGAVYPGSDLYVDTHT
jgi:hypothetical protein